MNPGGASAEWADEAGGQSTDGSELGQSAPSESGSEWASEQSEGQSESEAMSESESEASDVDAEVAAEAVRVSAHAAEAEHRRGWEGRGAPATEAQLRAAHFGAPPAPPGGADPAEEALRRGHMRTQLGPGPGGAGSGPGRGVGPGAILPMRAATRVEAADVSLLGPLVDPEERTEHVGYLRDRRGAPVAEVWEERPPPADGDYRRGPATSDRHMARLMG